MRQRALVSAFAFVIALVPALVFVVLVAASPPRSAPQPREVPQPRLEDFIAEPGSTQRLQPFMLHADLWEGIDKRAKLDTIVFVLENGARCAKVTNRDSTWVVDYTWVFTHNLLPPKWYDARGLIRAGDSLGLPEDAAITFTFGTLRKAVHAVTLGEATVEAYRQWPSEMPVALRGRLRQKLERAQKAMTEAARADTLAR